MSSSSSASPGVRNTFGLKDFGIMPPFVAGSYGRLLTERGDLIWVFLAPVRPRLVGELVGDPCRVIGLRRERLDLLGELLRGEQFCFPLGNGVTHVRFIHRGRDPLTPLAEAAATMLVAEVEPAAEFTAVGLPAADVAEPTVDLLGAVGVVAPRGHAVADVALPVRVVADRPAHQA